MKKDIHPTDYRPVVFEDSTTGFRFLTSSTAKSNETTAWDDGNTYPLIHVHISSSSHPFYTGQEKLVDTEGRVDRFAARLKAAETRRDLLGNKAKKASTEQVKKTAKVETAAR